MVMLLAEMHDLPFKRAREDPSLKSYHRWSPLQALSFSAGCMALYRASPDVPPAQQ